MFATANPSGGGFDVRCLTFDLKASKTEIESAVKNSELRARESRFYAAAARVVEAADSGFA